MDQPCAQDILHTSISCNPTPSPPSVDMEPSAPSPSPSPSTGNFFNAHALGALVFLVFGCLGALLDLVFGALLDFVLFFCFKFLALGFFGALLLFGDFSLGGAGALVLFGALGPFKFLLSPPPASSPTSVVALVKIKALRQIARMNMERMEIMMNVVDKVDRCTLQDCKIENCEKKYPIEMKTSEIFFLTRLISEVFWFSSDLTILK